MGTLTLDLVLRLGGFKQGADAAERELERINEKLRITAKEGERLAASVATPFESFAKSIALYQGLLKDTTITQETYNRLITKTTAELAAANTAQQTLSKAQQEFNAGVLRANELLQAGTLVEASYIAEVERLKVTLDAANKAEAEHAKAFANAQKLAAAAITPLEQYRAKLQEIAAAKIAAPQLITPQVEGRLTRQARAEFEGADPRSMVEAESRAKRLAEGLRSYNAMVAEGKRLTEQFGTTAKQQYADTFKALTRLALAKEITPEIRTAALKEAKALLDSLNPEIQKKNALEAEAQRINQANIGPQEAHNAAVRHLDLLLEETTLSVSAYNKEIAKEDAILKAATTSQNENNKAFANAKRLAASARTDLEQYLDAIREIGAAKIAFPELITPPVQARLTRGVEERFDPKTKQEIAQRQELDRILQANITTLERYQAELRVVQEAQKSGTGDANELAKATVRLQAAIDAETPALQKQKAAMEAAKATAASMVPPLQAVADRMAEIRAQALAFPTIVTPTIETAALKEQQARLDDLNGVTRENNRLEAEAKRIKAANIGPQQDYNNALALTAELVRRNQISQAEANAENARAKAILDSQDAALKEHNALMAEGARLTQSMLSPQQIYDAEIARANKLLATYDATLKRTAIDQETYNRTVARSKAALEAATNGVAKQSKGFFALRQDLLGINGLLIRFTSIYTAFAAIRGIIKIVDDYKLLENRLTTVTESASQLSRVQNDLFEIAQRTRQAYSGVVDLYVRLAQAGKELGASQSNLLKFTEAVGNAFAISGTTAERARAALVQLSQGLATGTFRAEEFNSVNEASPALIRAVAQNIDRFKGSVGALRNAVREGTLTSKEFFEGTIKASAELAKTVAGMPLTISQAFAQLRNTFEKIVSTADMGPLVDSIKNITTMIKDPAFQRDLALFVNLILKLAGAGVQIGATIGRALEELSDGIKSFNRDIKATSLSELYTPTIEDLEVDLKRAKAQLDDFEKGPFLETGYLLSIGLDKTQILKDIQEISDEIAVLQNRAGTAFQMGTGFAGRGRYSRGGEPRVANLAVDKVDKDAEAAQKSILGLIDSMKQQMAVTGETEEATIQYRIAFGDLRDEFAKAGPAFAKYKDELIKTARALDQFKARQDIKKQTEALRAEVVELQAARIEEEQGAVAALKFRREHNVEMAKTIALARGETVALSDTVEAVKAIPPIKLKVDTTEATAAIKKVADIPTPTLKVDTAQAVTAVKRVTDPWELMQKNLETPATVKVETAQAEAALKKTKGIAGGLFGEFGPVMKVRADTAQAVAAIDEVKKKTYAFTTEGIKFQPKIDTTAADVLLRKLEELNKKITLTVGVDISALEKQRSEILKQLAALPAAQLKLVTDTTDAEAKVAAVKQKAGEPVALKVTADTTQAVAAMNAAAAATQEYNNELKIHQGLVATAAKEQLTAVNSVAAQIQSITDETTAVFQNKIALEEGAVAALNYRIAQGDLKKTFEQAAGAEYLVVIKTLNAELAAGTGNQKALTEALREAERAYAKSQVAAANLADQLRIVTEYQERLAHQQEALDASFQYIPDAEAAAKQYALAVEGLTERWKRGEFGAYGSAEAQKKLTEAVKAANKTYKDAIKGLDEMSVFAEQAAKNMQDAFAEFLFDPFSSGLDGMLEGFAKTLRKMAAELVAAKLFEKFNIEDALKPGGLTKGPLTEWLKGKFGFGEKAPELQPITVHTEQLPRTMSDAALAEAEKILAVPSTALQQSAATLQTSSAALQTGATTLQTGATTLGTAANALLTATQALGEAPAAIAQPVAAAVIDEFPEIVVSQERLPVGGVVPAVGASRVAAGGAVGAQGAGVAGIPAGAQGLTQSTGQETKELADTAKQLALMSIGLVEPALQPLISILISLSKVLPMGGGIGGFPFPFGGGGTGGGGSPIQTALSGFNPAVSPYPIETSVPGAVSAALPEAAGAVEATAAATALTTAGTTVAAALTTAGTTAAAALTTAGTTMAGAITVAGRAAAAAIAAAASAGGAGAGMSALLEGGFDFSGAGFAAGGFIHADSFAEQPTLLRTLDRLARSTFLKRASGGPTDVRPGGPLHGPGTPTSDSLLLWGSTGEFMVQAKVVQQPGARAFLDQFNRGQIRMETLRDALKDLPHFHSGGPIVNVVAPAYANGGRVMPTMGTVSQDRQAPTVVQQITVNSPNGQVSKATELQITAAAARGARVADQRNN